MIRLQIGLGGISNLHTLTKLQCQAGLNLDLGFSYRASPLGSALEVRILLRRCQHPIRSAGSVTLRCRVLLPARALQVEASASASAE